MIMYQVPISAVNTLMKGLVAAIYLWTYLLSIVFAGYLLLWVFGIAEGVESVRSWELAGFLCLPGLSIFALWCRYEFDLIRMQDGTSAPSRFIWTILATLMNASLTYAFWKNIL